MTETPTCRGLPAYHADLQTFVLQQDTWGCYGNPPSCQGCRWTLFNQQRRHPWKMILTDRETSKIKTLNPCPLAALMFPSSFFLIYILILSFTRAFMNSLSSSGSLPLLLCHLLLPVKSKPHLLEKVKQRFCWKSTNLHSSFC